MEQPRNNRIDRDRLEIDRVRYNLDRVLPPQREIKWIGDVLQDVVEGLEKPLQENILILRKIWPELVSTPIAKHSKPEYIRAFRLQIFVDHPGWLSELERIKRPLLLKLRSNYPEFRIRKLHFSLQH